MTSTKGHLTGAVLLLGLTLLLGAAPGASAWHWEDEEAHTAYGSRAGDPRTVEDAGECLEEVQDRDEVTCMVFYPHLDRRSDTMPMNTQRPPDCAQDVELSPFPLTVGHEGLQWYASAGPAEYEVRGDGTCKLERIHPERGLSRDLVLSPEHSIIGYWHLSSDLLDPSRFLAGPGETPSAGAMPCVTVEITMQTGRTLGEGDVIAQGTTTKTILSTPRRSDLDPPPVEDPCPDSQGTIHPGTSTRFRVDLGGPQQDVPRWEGLIVHVRWFQWDGQVMDQEPSLQQSQWKVHTGTDHLNRIVVPVVAPLAVERLDLQEHEGTFFIRATIDSPLGSYDVDAGNIRVEVRDGAGKQVDVEHLQDAVLRNRADICGSYHPVNVTFPWDLDNEGLAPGTYKVQVTATNWQHTADAMKELVFTIPEQAETEVSPAGGFILTILPLASVLLCRRRTR